MMREPEYHMSMVGTRQPPIGRAVDKVHKRDLRKRGSASRKESHTSDVIWSQSRASDGKTDLAKRKSSWTRLIREIYGG
jgi:hypothetical protein